MTRRLLARVLAGWVALTALGCVAIWAWSRIDEGPMPSGEAGRWALASLEAARVGGARPAPPEGAEAFRAAGPIFVTAWWEGRSVGRHVGTRSLVETVDAAARAFAADESVLALEGWGLPGDDPRAPAFTVGVYRGEGPLWWGVPFVENLGVVPLEEGLRVSIDGRDAWATPEELLAEGSYDRGVQTPLPDLTFGVPVDRVADRLARELGVELADVLDRGAIARFRARSITPSEWPAEGPVDEARLREAAVDGARFLLRHQRRDGSYVYVYSGRTGRSKPEGYNMPRHAGTTHFLAQVHRLHGLPEAREGAIRALRWLRNRHVERCGGPDLWCVQSPGGHAEVGSAALAALAAAEVLATGDDPQTRELLEGLTAFLRSMQREDGELMHEYDLANDRPIDVQYLYYSGEAAFALLRAHAVNGDERNLEVAERLMQHLTGAGWAFLGSRYYYGEEHWTCIAAAEASDRIRIPAALDFCERWASFNRQVQYREGETPWAASGGYGVGPLIVPRLTPVASRTEAFISTWEMADRAGHDTTELRAQVERGLGMLLRWRWAPGPTHLLADPLGAHGGIPGSPVELEVRNDYVQHACSAMIRWADILKREAAGAQD